MNYLKKILPISFLFILLTFQLQASYLVRIDNKLFDSQGNEVRLTGINWFGFETSNLLPHGLWCRDYQSMLQQIKDLGFNCVRIPWCNAVITSTQSVNVNTWGPDPYNGTHPMNSALENKTPIEALDVIIAEARALGLKVILDNHSRMPDGYMNESLWYTSSFSERQWINDWVFMANRYANNSTVVAFDLNNEPHGNATWGSGNLLTDWRLAAQACANAVQVANSDVLIIIEGVETCGGTTYWWGGNLRGVESNPISITYMDKLVYSSHEYGPEVYAQTWFNNPLFPANMDSIWHTNFGSIMAENTGHVLIGEFGVKNLNAYEGKAGIWFSEFLQYAGTDYSWTYWCFNPNSGDTEGILKNDWVSVNQWKMDSLTPYLAPLISNTVGLDPVTPSPGPYLSVLQSVPNPFSNKTHLQFILSEASEVEVYVYDIQGTKICNLVHDHLFPGEHQVTWNGIHNDGHFVGKGTYFITLKAGAQIRSKKIVFLH